LEKVKQSFVPYDKSWLMRMGVLDLLDHSSRTVNFLNRNYGKLSEDLKSLLRASEEWPKSKEIHVGESEPFTDS